jgi:hypothetical protein
MQPPINTGNTESRFLSLPPELRNEIYRLALTKPGRIWFLCGTHHFDKHAVPPLLQVCRQIRDEALPIYFGGNSFSFFITLALQHKLEQFVTTIGYQSLQQCASVILLGPACGMCESVSPCHVYEINFQKKIVKQAPTSTKCEADYLNLLQPVMRFLPRIIRECDLETSNATDLGFLARQLIHTLTDLRVYFKY